MVVSMEKWIGKVAVVTGASSGIGAAIAEKLVKEGLIVVGLARRSQLVEELASKLTEEKGKLYAIKADVGIEEDITKAFEWITQNLGVVHVLVNNAVFRFAEPLLTGNTEHWKRSFDVNVVGLSIATREAVNRMRENKVDGYIVHINSVSGHQVYYSVDNDVYPATKYAVTALSETLRLELANIDSQIRVTSISPGVVDTPIFTKERRASDFFKSRIGDRMLQAEDIADAVVYVLSTPPHVQVKELIIKPTRERF